MTFSEMIKSRWNPKFERHVVGNIAHDAIGRALACLDAIESARAKLPGDVNLSERGKKDALQKVAASQVKTVEAARRTLAMGRDAIRDQRAKLVPKPSDPNNVGQMMLRQEMRGILRQNLFADLLTLFGTEGTSRELYEAFFEAPAGIMGVTEQQRDQLIAITVERLGGPALVAIQEQNEALDVLQIACARVCDLIVESAGITGHQYGEYVAKVAPVDEVTIAAEKAAFSAEVNRPAEEITPLLQRSTIVRQLLETGEAA